MLLGPFLDRYVSAAWVFNYDWNVPALTFLALSCACAVGVNVSQFMCLGRFSAVSYQVRGSASVWGSKGRTKAVAAQQQMCLLGSSHGMYARSEVLRKRGEYCAA